MVYVLSSYPRSRHLAFVSVTGLWNALKAKLFVLWCYRLIFVVFDLSYLHVKASRSAALPNHGEKGRAALAPRLPWFVL